MCCVVIAAVHVFAKFVWMTEFLAFSETTIQLLFHELASFTFDWRLPSCCKQQAILLSKQWFSGMLEILLLAMEWKTAYCEWLLHRAKCSFIVSAYLNWSGEIFYQKITHSKQFSIIQLVLKREVLKEITWTFLINKSIKNSHADLQSCYMYMYMYMYTCYMYSHAICICIHAICNMYISIHISKPFIFVIFQT